MNYFIMLMFPWLVLASGEQLTSDEHNAIHGYNKKTAIQLRQKQKMHQLHKVDEEDLRIFVKEETGEAILTSELTHVGKYLIYKVKTTSYQLQVNALDKSILKKETLK